jgi:hypothetical protein
MLAKLLAEALEPEKYSQKGEEMAGRKASRPTRLIDEPAYAASGTGYLLSFLRSGRSACAISSGRSK